MILRTRQKFIAIDLELNVPIWIGRIVEGQCCGPSCGTYPTWCCSFSVSSVPGEKLPPAINPSPTTPPLFFSPNINMTRLIALLLAGSVNAGWIQETWSITQLTTHFMGKNSGLGDGTWPVDSDFPSTANFILRQSFRKGPAVGGLFRESGKSEHNDVHCGATWIPSRNGGSVVDAGKMPNEWVMCEEERNKSLGFRFRFMNLTEGVSANPTGFGMELSMNG